MYCATKILVIGDGGDDQQAQRTAISSAEPGWQLDFCDSGQAALEEVRSRRPNCIVLDNQLPDMGALECFRAIRNLTGNTMPVLMLAAQDNQWNAAEALNLGVQDYLFKDARGNYLALLPAVLKKTLREHRVELEQRSAQDALSQLWHNFEHLFSDLSDGIVLANQQLIIESINPAACLIFGYETHELYGQPVQMLVHPSDRFRYDREFDAYARTGVGKVVGQGVHEVRGLGKGGTTLSLDIKISEIGFEGRRFYACVVRNAAQQFAIDAVGGGAGLDDRAGFEAAIACILRSSRNGDRTHTLALLKLGRFDEAGRECGPLAGNQLARQVAALLAGQTRKSDRLARLAVGEFGLLLEGCRLERAMEVAGKLIEAVRSFRFDWGGRGFSLDLGIGLAQIDERKLSVNALLAGASRACELASCSGRFGIHVLDEVEGLRHYRPAQPEWLARLKQAIEQDEFQLFFQRIFPLGEGASRQHFEILLRYMDADGGVHLPHDFIPAAERHGLEVAIDRWVLRRLLRDPAPEILREAPGSFLSMNLSGAALADPDFHAFALEELRGSRLSPNRLCFEISEANAIGNLPLAMQFIHALKDEGYRFALDDFDGGLSSFAYLKSLPVDYLKVNGDAAQGTAGQAAFFATVESVHRIAEGMGIATVAKSVESDEAICRLRTLGIDYAQGFGLHTPEPLFPSAPA